MLDTLVAGERLLPTKRFRVSSFGGWIGGERVGIAENDCSMRRRRFSVRMGFAVRRGCRRSLRAVSMDLKPDSSSWADLSYTRAISIT